MYLQDYFIFILALLACMVFSMIASGKVKSAYSTYSRVRPPDDREQESKFHYVQQHRRQPLCRRCGGRRA